MSTPQETQPRDIADGERVSIMHIEAVAIDLDGTLLFTDGSLAPKGREIIGAAGNKGVKIIIASTRNYHFVKETCDELGVADPIICTNGAQIYESPSGPLQKNHVIPIEVATELAQIADANGWEMSTTIGLDTYLKQRAGQEIGKYKECVYIVEKAAHALKGEPIRMLFGQADPIKAFSDLCRTKYNGSCRAETYYRPNGEVHSLCVFNRLADKGSALSFVLNRLKISQEHALAIGDNENDLPMFAVAGISIAMGNSVEKVKQEADDVAPSNDEEGVAWALKKYLFR